MALRSILVAPLLVICIAAANCGVHFGAKGAPDRSHGRLVYVTDGDTVKIDVGGRTVDVRLLGIDTPEKFPTRYGTAGECGAAAASALIRAFTGSRVTLVRDVSQDNLDRYGRLLRYVDLPNGRDLGGLAVARGLAIPYVVRDRPDRFSRYEALAEAARDQLRGSWSSCAGDFHSGLPGVQNGRREGR